MTLDQQMVFDFIGDLGALGAQLRRLREAEDVNLTVEDVARQAGRDAGWYTGVEAGEIEPTLRDLQALAHVFGAVFRIGFRPMDVIRSRADIPQFASESEEADWWCTHDLADELWEQARTTAAPDWLPPINPVIHGGPQMQY